MARIATKLQVGLAACAVAVGASLLSAPPAEAQPTSPFSFIGNAINQVFGFFGLGTRGGNTINLVAPPASAFGGGPVDLLNPPLQPVTNLHASDLVGPLAFLNSFPVIGLCQGGQGAVAGAYGSTAVKVGVQCG